MTNNLGENKDVICLSNRLIFHSIIFLLVLITHIIIFVKIYWMENLIKLLFLSFSFIEVVYILISIIPFILIKIRQIQSRIKYFKIISKVFFYFSLLIGLFFFIIIIINTVLVKEFCIECPFNLNFSNFVSNFDENFENKEEYTLKKNCRERRCLFNKYDEDSSYPYSYLCNYNAEEEFGVKDGELRQLNCKLFEPWYRDAFFTDETIYKYLDKCFSLADFYYCGRLQEPKKYELEEDENCPKKNYMYSIYFLCIYIFISDVVINIIIWYLQINSYALLSRINLEEVKTLNSNNNNINNNNQTNSTNANKNENNNNNQNANISIISNENNNKQNNTKNDNNNRNDNNQNNNGNINNNRNNNNLNNNRNNKSVRTRGDTILETNHNTIIGSTVVLIVNKNKNNNQNNNQDNNQDNNQNNNQNNNQDNKQDNNQNNNQIKNNVDKSNMDNEDGKIDSDRNNEENCKASTLLFQKKYTTNSDIQFANKITKSFLKSN